MGDLPREDSLARRLEWRLGKQQFSRFPSVLGRLYLPHLRSEGEFALESALVFCNLDPLLRDLSPSVAQKS